MAQLVRIPQSKVQRFFLNIDSFKGGSNTLINEARLRKDYAYEINNMWQVQDGIWKTRPGTAKYGQNIPGDLNIVGSCEYENNGTREVIAIAGTKAWKSVDGGVWTEITGATFTEGLTPFFLPIDNKLYITNGTDSLCYYDGTNLNTYSSISAPSNIQGSRTTLTTGSYNNWYTVVAVNDVGYTTPGTSVNVTTNKERLVWSSGEKLTITWDAVSGANAYQVYYGEFQGEEVYLGTTTTTSFDDDGSAVPNPYLDTPNDNTTGAPRFRTMEVSGNRIWATYDPDNEYRVYFSGTGQYMGYFSPFYGGGYIDLEKGGKNKPISVTHYRTGKGDPTVTVLCKSADGLGTIFQVDLTDTTVSEVTFTIPSAAKIVGSIGAGSPYGVVKAGDNVYFINEKGVFALRNKPQLLNVLSTDDFSAPIRNKFESLNQDRIIHAAGYYKPPRIFFAVSEGSTNDKIAIYDSERNNWTWSWTLGVNQFLEYTDSSETTHFLGVNNQKPYLIEISDNFFGDEGEAFYQSYISPLIRVSENYTDRAKVKDVVFEIGNLEGNVTCQVLALTEEGQVTSFGSATPSSNIGTSGIGDDGFSDVLFSDTQSVPSTFTQRTRKVRVRVNKKLYAIQFKVFANSLNSRYELLGIQVTDGYLLPTQAPSSWN